MRAVEIIGKKRDRQELTTEEIAFFVKGFARGDIPDYQTSAWAMAVLLQGMTPRETIDLTMAMVNSGDVVDLSGLAPIIVDKHSTGGVGDKTTLVVAPLVAAAGLPIVKMSGRGLGFSGGTLDKLESIPGMNVTYSLTEFMSIARQHGIIVAGQTSDLVPADGKLYALRDVTATVPSLPLIASSIMSKKIAGGADAIVLDVKVGRGAFMTTIEDARALADAMIGIGARVGRRVTAILSDMSQPLGQAIGNALEVQEAIDTLKGGGPSDFVDHCLAVGAEMLRLGGIQDDPDAGSQLLASLIDDGTGLSRFREWLTAQAGDAGIVDDALLLPQAPVVRSLMADRDGIVASIDPREVGMTSVMLGAGREKKGDSIDHAVGIVLGPKVGEPVRANQPLLWIHAATKASAKAAGDRLRRAVRIADGAVKPPPLVYDILRG